MARKNLHLILTKEILEKEYSELKSYQKIANKYKVSIYSVGHYINKYNIPHIAGSYSCNNNIFQFENEKTFYLAGFIAADGCIQEDKRSVKTKTLTIKLSTKDKKHLIKLKEILETTSPIRDYFLARKHLNPNWNDTYSSTLSVVSEQIFNDLKKFNIVSRKSLIYTFPEWLINHPLVHHFMRGYNDGDGSFWLKTLTNGEINHQIGFELAGTKEFLDKYKSILDKNCNFTDKNINKNTAKHSGIYRLSYGGNIVLSKIVNFLYKDATIYLDRKYDIIKHLLIPT